MKKTIMETISKLEDIKDVAVLESTYYVEGLRISEVNNKKNKENATEIISNESDINIIEEVNNNLSIVLGEELKFEAHEPKNLSEVLRKCVNNYGQKGIKYISDNGEEVYQTYVELLESAEIILSGLRKSGLEDKDKLIFLFDKNDDFIQSFWACILGGIIPIPITMFKDFRLENSEINSFLKIWGIMGKPKIISSKKLDGKFKTLEKESEFDSSNIIYIEDLHNNMPDKNWVETDPDSTAIILFTSGSTGLPKGVMQTHKSILAREKGTIEFNNFTSNEVSVNWMPIEHVASIVMFHVKEVYLGCSQVQVRTNYILNNPLRWIDLLSQYNATITWAPNFAFELVNQCLKDNKTKEWELSSVRVITNAAEAINTNTSKKFLKLLEPYGLKNNVMYPSWGMSETCSCVIYSEIFTLEGNDGVKILHKDHLETKVKEVQENSNSVSFAELGITVPGVDMRIVDKDNVIVKESIIGNLQIRGQVVTKGYYNNKEANDKSFTSDGWFDTGDLAFIKNGRVTLTGRLKEVIIINGVHYANSEIENIVNDVKGVKITFCAACGIFSPEKGRDSLVIFFVPCSDNFEDVINTINIIKDKLLLSFGISADYIIPIKIEEFPKTNIGKIQRSKLVKSFKEDKFIETIKKINYYNQHNSENTYNFLETKWCKEIIVEKNNCYDNLLIFQDEVDIFNILCKNFDKKIIAVIKGSNFEKINDNLYKINPLDSNDYKLLVGSLNKQNINIKNIIHGWNLNKSISKIANTLELEKAQYNGIYSVVNILQAIGKVESKYNILYITNNAQCVLENDDIDIRKITIDGLLKSIPLEINNIKACHVDLDDINSENITKVIINELKGNLQNDLVAYRNGVRFIQKLKNIKLDNDNFDNDAIKYNGTYVITGGLGGVGAEISKHLLLSYQVKLIIIGRSRLSELSLDSSKVSIYEELTDYGNVEYYSVDICDYNEFNKFVRNYSNSNNEKIDGIFHLAGESMDNYWSEIEKHNILNEKISNYNSMFKAKVYGSWVISEVFKNFEDFQYMFFSSVNGFFGGNSVSSYSAANSFIDIMSFYLSKRLHKNCKCLSWSTWLKIGMNKGNNTSIAAVNKGFQNILLDDGIYLFSLAMRNNNSNILLGLDINNPNINKHIDKNGEEKINYNIFYTSNENKDLEEILRNTITEGIDTKDKNLKFFKLESIPVKEGKVDYTELKNLLSSKSVYRNKYIKPSTDYEVKIAKIWQDVLEVNNIGILDKFFDIGGNSIRTIQVKSNIEKTFGIEVPTIDLYKNNILKDLADYIKKLAN